MRKEEMGSGNQSVVEWDAGGSERGVVYTFRNGVIREKMGY